MTFTQRVNKIVSRIPKGKTLSYSKVASLAGNDRAARAVGSIMNKNTSSDIPCHRVICSDGSAGGYNRGTKAKIKKLKSEHAL